MSESTNQQTPEAVGKVAGEPTAPFTSGPQRPASPASGGSAPAVHPSGCDGCNAAAGPVRQFAYALGEIGYDFPSQARRDSIKQQMKGNPEDPAHFLDHLTRCPWDAGAVIWTLKLDETPIYALLPGGPHAATGFERLREFLGDQLQGKVERVSIPGVVGGKMQLPGGQSLPILWPDLRGMYSWTTAALMEEIKDKSPAVAGDVGNFLERVYYELRNLGLTPQERALNFAATNAFQVESVYRSAIEAGLKLDSMAVERSPTCRPESDCWDVKLTFFHPTKRLEHAREVYRFTVDVSDVVPVTIGKVRRWHVY